LIDPDPVDSRAHGKIGFEAHQSMIRVSSLVVRRIAWKPRVLMYAPEFEE
jgi:hypothetical protein